MTHSERGVGEACRQTFTSPPRLILVTALAHAGPTTKTSSGDRTTRGPQAVGPTIHLRRVCALRGSGATPGRPLQASHSARAHVARWHALTGPFSPSPRISFDGGFRLVTMPGW